MKFSTPLEAGICQKNYRMSQLLASAGANVNPRRGFFLGTKNLLGLAKKIGDEDIIRLLSDKDVKKSS